MSHTRPFAIAVLALAAFGIGLLLQGAAPLSAQPESALIGYVPSDLERLGEAPTGLAVLADGRVAVLDAVNDEVVVLGADARMISRSAEPVDLSSAALRSVGRVVQIEGGSLFGDQRRRETLSARIEGLSDPNGPVWMRMPPETPPEPEKVRDGDALILRLSDGVRIVLQPLDGWRVAVATLEATERRSRNRIVSWEETREDDNGLQAVAYVGRFTPRGERIGVARLDMADFDPVPRAYVAAGEDGRIVTFARRENGLVVRDVDLDRALPPPPPPLAPPAIRTQILDALDSAMTAADTSAAPTPPAPGTISRADILARARAFIDLQWQMGQQNYAHANVANACDPANGNYWRRPTRLNGAVGTTVQAVPYRWGGFDDPTRFASRIAQGALAGDVCTCRDATYNYCLVPAAAGVDCSGFVSRAWGLNSHHGTSRLPDVATRLPNTDALLPGDILNKSGAHVRLFVERVAGPEDKFVILESSVGCGGACEQTLSPTQFNGYRPYRYNHVS